jgi:lantibiotic modifying enzyme
LSRPSESCRSQVSNRAGDGSVVSEPGHLTYRSVPLPEDVGSGPFRCCCVSEGRMGQHGAMGNRDTPDAGMATQGPHVGSPGDSWTAAERSLADQVIARLRTADLRGDCGLYTGLAGSMTVIGLLGGGRHDDLLTRLGELRTPLGWPSPEYEQAPLNDLFTGTAGIVLTMLWYGGAEASRLAALGADALGATARPTASGVEWKMYEGDWDRWMPNCSHGTAGIATALAVAGRQLDRPELVELARLGAEQLVSLADTSGDGFRAPLQIPAAEGYEQFSYGWCHGPTGTANLFGALELARVKEVGGRTPTAWRAAAARTLASSGLPERRYDGFWDNDGRCCGTAGVLDAVLDLVQVTGESEHLAFANRLAAAIVERSEPNPANPQQRYWRFYEHRVRPPYLDPGVGWMQGAAGIAAALFRYARVRERGVDAKRLPFPDDWWMTPAGQPMGSPASFR